MNESRRCTAHSSRTKDPCKRWAIRGGTVCPTHGGRIPKVKAAAAQRLLDLIDPERALREAAALAYSDIRELYYDSGRPKPMSEWPKWAAHAVKKVQIIKKNVTAGDGEQEDVLHLELWDKPKNLEMLFKHLGLLIERVQHSGGLDIRWQTDADVIEGEIAGRKQLTDGAKG